MEFLGIWIFVEVVRALFVGTTFVLSALVHVMALLIRTLLRVLFFWIPGAWD